MTPGLQAFHLNTLPRTITEFEWERYGPIARRTLLAGGTMEGVRRVLDEFGRRMTDGQTRELQPLEIP